MTDRLPTLLEGEQTTLQLSTSEETKIRAEGYLLLDKLGEGSYAKVYLAEYLAPGQSAEGKVKLACKVYDRDKVSRDIEYTFLPRELDVLMRLDPGHPHVIHIHSIFQRRSKVFIFMGYVANGELLEYVQRHGAVDERQARVWFRQLVLAVQYLHALDIAHRDVTCQNILLSSNLNLKLADFGFARITVDRQGQRLLSETYCGSPAYAAPEVLLAKPYDPKMADVWSCGIVLYVMLNKAMPFDFTNIGRLLKHQMSKKWKFRNSVRSVLSLQVKTLAEQVIEPKVGKRLGVDQMLASDWIAMDPRLLGMSELEGRALEAAKEARGQGKGHSATRVTLIDLKQPDLYVSVGRRKSSGSYSSRNENVLDYTKKELPVNEEEEKKTNKILDRRNMPHVTAAETGNTADSASKPASASDAKASNALGTGTHERRRRINGTTGVAEEPPPGKKDKKKGEVSKKVHKSEPKWANGVNTSLPDCKFISLHGSSSDD